MGDAAPRGDDRPAGLLAAAEQLECQLLMLLEHVRTLKAKAEDLARTEAVAEAIAPPTGSREVAG
jgi:hypothetical protein